MPLARAPALQGPADEVLISRVEIGINGGGEASGVDDGEGSVSTSMRAPVSAGPGNGAVAPAQPGGRCHLWGPLPHRRRPGCSWVLSCWASPSGITASANRLSSGVLQQSPSGQSLLQPPTTRPRRTTSSPSLSAHAPRRPAPQARASSVPLERHRSGMPNGGGARDREDDKKYQRRPSTVQRTLQGLLPALFPQGSLPVSMR
jgi:hypothetical protein